MLKLITKFLTWVTRSYQRENFKRLPERTPKHPCKFKGKRMGSLEREQTDEVLNQLFSKHSHEIFHANKVTSPYANKLKPASWKS
ncbi:hypothetical protein MKW92_007086, partial [Papaver armeniacum]